MSEQAIDQLSPEFVAAYANWLGVTEGEAYTLLKADPLIDITDEAAVQAAAWEESKHPREPSGSKKGGQFAPKETLAEAASKPLAPGEYDARQKLSSTMHPLPTGARVRVTGGPNPGLWEKQEDGRWFKVLPDGIIYPRGISPTDIYPGTAEVVRREAPTEEPLGAERDPSWEGDPVHPEPTRYGGQVYSAVENSDAVWNGAENPAMGYGIDQEYFREALGTDDQALSNYRNETEGAMRSVGEEGELRIQTPFDHMGDIIDDGRFKSQFEVPYSQGAFLPEVRAAQEQLFFGYKQDIPPEQRPIYGWVDHPDAESLHDRMLGQYGEVTWMLNPELKNRTTISFVDSLSRPVVPGPIRDPGWRATVPPGYEDNGMSGMVTDHRYDTGLFDDVLEAQYHGGVSLDDVTGARVTMASYGSWTDQDRLDIGAYAARLADKGIPLEVEDEYGNLIFENGHWTDGS